MPSITINVNEEQSNRIKEALKDPVTGTLPTANEVEAWVKDKFKEVVTEYEMGKLSTQSEITRKARLDDKKAELSSEGW